MQQQIHRIFSLRIKHLRLLERLIEHNSLRKAAESLHMSEPAASQMVRDMETTLGVTMFERGRRGMTPNENACVMAGRVRVILRELQGIESDVASLAARREVSLNLGSLPRCLHALVPTTLAHLYRNDFRPRVHITEGSSTQIFSALERGDLDIAVTRLLDGHADTQVAPRFGTEVLYEEGMVIVGAVDHELANERTVNLEALTHYGWVLPPPGSVTRKLIEAEFINGGFLPPIPKVESFTSVSQLNLVRRSAFLGICPVSVAIEWEQRNLLRVIKVALRVPLPPISVVWPLTKGDDSGITAIKDALLHCANTVTTQWASPYIVANDNR